MEKNTSKKLLTCLCALSAGFVLAACDPISAVPTNYEDAIVLNADGSKVDLKDNLMGKIYDAIATDRNTKVVSDILDEIATNKYGEFGDIFEMYDIENATVKEDKIGSYLEKYGKAFKKDDDISGEVENRVKIFVQDIFERISESFYNEITSGSYNDDEGRFDEEKLWMAHYYEFYDLGNKPVNESENVFYVTNKLTKENALQTLKGRYCLDYSETAEQRAGKRGYIEEKVFPTILKDKLVEDYVYENNPGSLGRSYARNVTYIKVSYENHVLPWKMLKAFAKNHIETSESAIDFDMVENSLKGFTVDGSFINGSTSGVKAMEDVQDVYDSYNLMNETFDSSRTVTVDASENYKLGDITLIEPGTYYKDTKIGELIESYQKALKAEEDGRFAKDDDKAELDKFSSNNKSKQWNLREKIVSLAKEDYTTDGWFIKNGGLTELPGKLRDRLFNLAVANTLDNDSLVEERNAEGQNPSTMGDYQYTDAEHTTLVKRTPYMRNIYGKKMVIPANADYEENPYNYIYNDTEGKAYYIVQVHEAPSTSKLNESDDKNSYAALDPEHPFRSEEISRQVAKVLGTKDSYIKDAYTSYLENYTFTFFETSLYEHFKSEYPDLFDDED